MEIIERDITTIETGVIGHQCNCRGVMGAGVALAIRNKYPKAYKDYLKAYEEKKLRLGKMIISNVNDDEESPLYIAHLCGQFNFGRRGFFTNYDALTTSLIELRIWRKFFQMVWGSIQIYLPYGIGCGLAGGDWKKVEPIIESIIPDVILCKLEVK